MNRLVYGGLGGKCMVLTGLMLKVTPVVCILGATGRDFQASNTRLKGWVALPTETVPV